MQQQNLANTTELRNYFEIQVQEIVINAGKRAILWEEVRRCRVDVSRRDEAAHCASHNTTCP